jgi:hypothetical protein
MAERIGAVDVGIQTGLFEDETAWRWRSTSYQSARGYRQKPGYATQSLLLSSGSKQ